MAVKIATGEVEEPTETDDGKNKATVELGRGSGKARAENMTAECQGEIARQAVTKRLPSGKQKSSCGACPDLLHHLMKQIGT